MKTAEEIFEEELSGEPLHQDVVIEAIKIAQLDAIEETVKLCAEKALLMVKCDWGTFENAEKNNSIARVIIEKDVVKRNERGHGDSTYQIITVSKQSILNCAEILKKEL